MSGVDGFPPVRACLFDMDGLLINTEDIYTKVTNLVLRSYGRPDLPWHVKAQLQGLPTREATRIFTDWAQLPISPEEYQQEVRELQRQRFPDAAPLPGVELLLSTLLKSSPRGGGVATSEGIEIALATSSGATNYRLKTTHLQHLMGLFPEEQRVLGDDPRIAPGKGKPAPDIYLLALETINQRLRKEGRREIEPKECLVFEDAVPGVGAGRRAGMRVVWVPHPGLREEYAGREAQVLAGVTGAAKVTADHGGAWGSVGVVGDGWGELRSSLEVGPDWYAKYGIVPPGTELDSA